jgi:hypothetical protein
MRALSAFLAFVGLAAAARAADLPGDVQAYVDRREACNYWPSETAPRHSHRADEIEHHLRSLHCDTLDREEAVMRARYPHDHAALDAMDQAHDALPDN